MSQEICRYYINTNKSHRWDADHSHSLTSPFYFSIMRYLLYFIWVLLLQFGCYYYYYHYYQYILRVYYYYCVIDCANMHFKNLGWLKKKRKVGKGTCMGISQRGVFESADSVVWLTPINKTKVEIVGVKQTYPTLTRSCRSTCYSMEHNLVLQ